MLHSPSKPLDYGQTNRAYLFVVIAATRCRDVALLQSTDHRDASSANGKLFEPVAQAAHFIPLPSSKNTSIFMPLERENR
jgi:hypothetical protein